MPRAVHDGRITLPSPAQSGVNRFKRRRAPIGREMCPAGTSASRLLMRINVPPYFRAISSQTIRTVGTAPPLHRTRRSPTWPLPWRRARPSSAHLGVGPSSNSIRNPRTSRYSAWQRPHTWDTPASEESPAWSPGRSRLGIALRKDSHAAVAGTLHPIKGAMNFDNLFRSNPDR